MASSNLNTAPSDSAADSLPDDAATRAQLLADANINPRTGLATDYLNHFNEAIMLLEMIPDMPDCAEDFLNWQPLSYRDHFSASNFKARELAISSYERSDATLRAEFDSITNTMTSILIAVGDAMRESQHDSTRTTLAEQATGWIKPLLTLAGSIINGSNDEADIDQIMNQRTP
jgi:hypothetical protein